MLTVGASVKAVSTMLGHATVAFTLDRYNCINGTYVGASVCVVYGR